MSKLASGCCRPIFHGERTPTRFPQTGELILLNVTSDSTLVHVPSSTSDVTLSSASPSSGKESEGGKTDVKLHPCIALWVFRGSVQNRWSFRVFVLRSYSNKAILLSSLQVCVILTFTFPASTPFMFSFADSDCLWQSCGTPNCTPKLFIDSSGNSHP
jgi:hypothetical protein